jgi:hypothetical protein
LLREILPWNTAQYDRCHQTAKAVQSIGYDLLEEENKQQETLEAIHAEKFKI